MSLRLAIGLISGAAIAYELLLMRIFSIIQWHHFAYMVISLALLGYGASGAVLTVLRRRLLERFEATFVSLAALFGLSAPLCFAAAQRLPLNPFELAWGGRQLGVLAGVYLVLAIPFLCAGGAIGLALARRSDSIHQIYRADLLGAAAGAAAVVGALYRLGPDDCLRLVGAAGGLAAMTSLAGSRTAPRGRPRGRLLVLCGLATAVSLLWPSSWLAPRMSEYKPLAKTLAVPGTEVVAERSSPLGALAAVRSERIPFRIAPGLSLAFRGEIPEQIVVFADGEIRAVIDSAPARAPDRDEDSRLDYLDSLPLALAFHLPRAGESPKPDRVALLGGSGLALARHREVGEIHVVEGNRQLLELVAEDLADFSGGLYGAAEVRLHPIDARGFLGRARGGFDLILQEVASAGAGGDASARSISEAYPHTVEAFRLALERLSDTGALALAGELESPLRTSLKLLATAAEALEGSGRDPLEHVAVIRSWNRFVILVKPSGVSAADALAIRAFCKDRLFDLAYLPGLVESEANRYHQLDEPALFRGARALLGPARESFIRDYKFRLAPATDDRPYFFHFFRWSSLGELLDLRSRGGAALLDVGYLALVAVLVQAALAGLVIILLPLRWVRSSAVADRGAGRIGIYFLCLGLAFLFLEIAFLQRMTLLLAEPLIAAAVVLAGFLLFAGLGSGASRRLEKLAARWSRDPIRLAASGIVILALAYVVALPPAFAAAMPWPTAAKVLVALVVIAPLAFLLGMPFPLGLRRVSAARSDLTPWAWGVNGWASVLSAVLATLIALHRGFSTVVIAACGLYLLAALSAPVAPKERPESGH